MPINYAAYCPALGAGDFIRLHPSIVRRDTGIHDTVADIDHAFAPSSYQALYLLAQGTTVSSLYVPTIGLTHEEVTELLGFCNRIGALTLRRAVCDVPHTLVNSLRSASIGVFHPALTHRYPASLQGVAIGALKACRILLLASFVVAMLLFFAYGSSLTRMLELYGYCMFTFMGSILVHEYGHMYVLRKQQTTCSVLQSGNRIAVLHAAHRNSKRASFAGPAAGCLFACLFLSAATAMRALPEAFYAAAVGLLHCINLLPFYADGKSLQHAKRTQKGGSL